MNEPGTGGSIIHSISLGGNTASYANIIAWSEENIIAFATEEGVNVLEPSIYSVGIDGYLSHSIKRHVIPSPKEINQFDFEVDRNEMHLKLPRNEMFSLMLDRTLSPAVACGPSYKGCRQIVWSSSGVGSNGTCVLAALTMDHRLTLSVYQEQTFHEVASISQMWFDYLKSINYQMPLVMNRSEQLFNDPSMQKLHHESYATSAAKIMWSHLIKTSNCLDDPDFVQESFAYLIVGLKNGCVVLWKAMSFLESCNDIYVEHYFDTCVGLISALHWVEIESNTGLLIVGSKFGEIHYYTVTADPSNSYHAIVAKGETLWGDRDRLEVSHISSLKDFDNSVYVLAGKGCFLVAWCISNGEVRRFHTVGDFLQPLTGLVADTDSFLATTGDGTLLRIEVNKIAGGGLSLTINHVMKEKEDPRFTFMGIAMSHNKVLYCMVQQIGSWFDHLAIREPNKLLIATSKSADEALSIILEMSDANILLSSISDILLHLYYSLLKQKQLPSNLTTLVECGGEELRLQSVVKLQLLRWLLRLVQFGEQDEEKVLKYKAQGDLVNKLLVKQQLLQLLRKIDLDHAESLLGIRWASSLAVICTWLATNIGELDATEKKDVDNVFQFVQQTSSMRQEQLLKEECRLCKQIIPLDNIHFGKCSNGHTFGRCCLSLAICDRPTYKRCRNCSVCAERHIFDLFDNPRCPFCSLSLS